MELKINSGPGYRVYLADDGKNSVILLAGPKASQKKDIKTTREYWKDYQSRE
jgi:putative addiction module killer protein